MSPLDAVRQIAREAGLDPVHPPEVLAEAEALVAQPGIDDPSLVDLTRLPFVTIDEESSKDLDQAVFVEPDGDGWKVWYAIADAAHFVRPGTALFAEALKRGSSYYLPGLVIPMLPRVLSEDIVSLNPGVDRRALVFEVALDDAGEVRDTAIHRARVHSRAKTWYDAVQEWLDGRRLCLGGPEIADSLRAMVEVGKRRMALAVSRHVVQFRRVELSIHLADGDLGFVARGDLRNDVERYNEQISLLCNVEGARIFVDAPQHVQGIFRTHEPPPDDRLDALEAQLRGLIAAHHLDPAVWGWRRGRQSIGAWLAGLPRTGPGGRIARALSRQVLLATGRAAFGASPGAHYGVGAEVYARFTAPMREVVGIFSHKECWERLGAEPAPDHEDEAIREAVIAGAADCRTIQRRLDQEANRLVLDRLFAADLKSGKPPRRLGTVMGLSRSKVHVQLDEPPVDVKVYRVHLAEQWGAQPTDDRTTLEAGGRPRLRVGDPVKVAVRGEDPERDRWRLALYPIGT